MNNDYEEVKLTDQNETGCCAMGYQDVNVCIPITIKAFGKVGNAKTQCLGKSRILSDFDACPGKPKEICKFMVCQKLRVEVPVLFDARAEAGEAILDCGCSAKGDGCCKKYEFDQEG